MTWVDLWLGVAIFLAFWGGYRLGLCQAEMARTPPRKVEKMSLEELGELIWTLQGVATVKWIEKRQEVIDVCERMWGRKEKS